MKIVHISVYDDGSGAARAAYRLHRGLLDLGCDSKMFLRTPRRKDKDPTVIAFHPPGDIRIRLRRRWRTMMLERERSRYPRFRKPGMEPFTDDRSANGEEVFEQLPAADIYHVHSIFGFMDYTLVMEKLTRRAPVVRALHDVNVFTGGCHVHHGCEKFTQRCGACPQLLSDRDDDLSRQSWERRRAALALVPPGRLHLLAPSRWLAGEARRSALAGQLPVEVIPLGLDTEVFRPRDRAAARDVLGIPADSLAVLFIAEPITRANKGLPQLLEALAPLSARFNLRVLVLGSGDPPRDAPVPIQPMGYVAHERFLSLVYSAADVFTIPSSSENFPLTVLEAMACAVPVVGFEVGGIPDMVRAGENGQLVPPGDIAALRDALEGLFRDPARRAAMGSRGREIAAGEYSIQRFAERHLEFYRRVLAAPAE
jgi:glycosyltransferase involved in cell wall biosynthesis